MNKKDKKLKIAVLGKYIDRFANYGMDMRVGWLVKGFEELGQDIKLYVWPDSEFKKKQIKIFDSKKNIADNFKNLAIVEKIIKDQDKYDIIFSQSNSILPFSSLIKKPIFHTVSFTDLKPERINLYQTYDKINYIAQSTFLKNRFKFNWSGISGNGISTENFKPIKNIDRKYFLYLGRIHPDKGVDIAVKICHENNLPLVIAGMCFDQNFFDTKIKPFLSENIKYVGEVNFKEKIKLYQQAKALLCPIRYNETFSNAMIEAMSCGTPVISFNKGSANEVIARQKTGFVVKNQKDFLESMFEIKNIKNKDCRERVTTNFTYQKMAQNYLDLFKTKL
jgi:glycosyltransferase involved in cell wall biosynthesis